MAYDRQAATVNVMTEPLPTIAILGASGLIGEALACGLALEGFSVVPMARRFTRAQTNNFGSAAIESSFTALDANGLAQLLAETKIDIVVNCAGVLQDGPRGGTDAVHRAFVERLVQAIASRERKTLLIHLSIPGNNADDRTSFSRTKRAGEQVIAAGRIAFVILRPGFVIAPTAYGGSALLRALAALPFDLSARERRQAFAATAMSDVVRTIAVVARRWAEGEAHWHAVWEVMEREPSTVGDVIDAFRHRLGGPGAWITLPAWLMGVGARAGDLVAHLGWSPPVRSTALAEMRRGVAGDPEPWIAATGIEPISLDEAVRRLPASVQEKWFARLYLLKPLILASLVAFWVLSGLIALTVSFAAATAVLSSHGFALPLAKASTVVSSLIDISVGLGIAFRKSCRIALVAGIAMSLFYMAGTALIMPDLWLEPLGALVKTIPAIALMLVALAMFEDR
jgi:nucleoside-diphosphate-sugar epimerase